MIRVRLGTAVSALLLVLSINTGTTYGAGAQTANVTVSPAIKQGLPPQVCATADQVRRNYWLAAQLASYEWLDKVAEADPGIVAAICSRPGPARVLAKHPHLDKIADADHYLCRRLCQYRRASDALVRNPHADHVIALDPQGFVMAMDRDPVYARIMAGHRQFYNLIYEDPELGKQIAKHIW